MKHLPQRILRHWKWAFLMMSGISIFLAEVRLAIPSPSDQTVTLAVLDFENHTGSTSYDSLAKAMTDMILATVVKSDWIRVVERSQIKKILEEQQLILSGLIDTGKVAYVGKMLAADQIVIGTLSLVEKEWIANIRLLEVKSGRILMAEMFEEKESSKILAATRKAGDLLLKTIQRSQKKNYRMAFLVSPGSGERRKMTSDEERKLLGVLRKKIEAYGTSARRISFDQGKVEIEMEGVTDPLELAKILMANDILEFKMVQEDWDPFSKTVPAGTEVLADMKGNSVAVFPEALLTGEMIEQASIAIDPLDRPSIILQFDPKGTARFSKITGGNIGKRLAMILNGRVLVAPVIREEIKAGKAEISGLFSLDEAFQLSVNLKSGTLPVSLRLSGLETTGSPK